MTLLLGFSLMGGGHKNDQIKCKNYDVEIEYEGKVIIGCIDFDDKICCWQLRNCEIPSPTTNFHQLLLRSHEGNDWKFQQISNN